MTVSKQKEGTSGPAPMPDPPPNGAGMPVVKRHLPVKLSRDRERDLGLELAEFNQDKLRLENVLAGIKKEHDKLIKMRTAQIDQTSLILHQGFEMLEVPCVDIVDLRQNRRYTKRLDTGEPVEGTERALTAEEREIFLKAERQTPSSV